MQVNSIDITRIIFENVVKVKTVEKYKALLKIYLDAIINKIDIENTLHSDFSRFIVELFSFQIIILKFIEKFEKDLIEIDTYQNFYELFVKYNSDYLLDKYEFKYYCNDIENKALITCEAGLDDFDSKNGLLALESHRPASVRLTSMGFKFLDSLK